MRRARFCAATRRRVVGDHGAQDLFATLGTALHVLHHSPAEKLGRTAFSLSSPLKPKNRSRRARPPPGTSGGLQ
jgi:hypothetical protein